VTGTVPPDRPRPGHEVRRWRCCPWAGTARWGILDALEGLAQLAAERDPWRAALLIRMADRVRAGSGLAGYDTAAFELLVRDVRAR
jgi:hypothetical protein